MAASWLRRSVAGFSPQGPGFDPRPVHVTFVVDKVALGQLYLPVLRLSPVRIMPLVLYTQLQLRVNPHQKDKRA